jgi:hypothetical protein
MCYIFVAFNLYNELLAQNRKFKEKRKHKARPITRVIQKNPQNTNIVLFILLFLACNSLPSPTQSIWLDPFASGPLAGFTCKSFTPVVTYLIFTKLSFTTSRINIDAPLTTCTNEEQCAVIFLWIEGIRGAEIHQNNQPSTMTVFCCNKACSNGLTFNKMADVWSVHQFILMNESLHTATLHWLMW